LLTIELGRDEHGRWIAAVPELPGVVVYASSPKEAHAKVITLAAHVIVDRIEYGESVPTSLWVRKIVIRR
jgi:predicted RNase H-like HicB family nuclease